jgi:hypothetical protein
MTTENKMPKSDSSSLIMIFAALLVAMVISADALSPGMRYLVVSHVCLAMVGGLLGKERKVGYNKAFFISLICSPIIGFILIFNSPRLKDEEYKQQILNQTGVKQYSPAEELVKLNDLRKQGVITDEEFDEQKAKILNA